MADLLNRKAVRWRLTFRSLGYIAEEENPCKWSFKYKKCEKGHLYKHICRICASKTHSKVGSKYCPAMIITCIILDHKDSRPESNKCKGLLIAC